MYASRWLELLYGRTNMRFYFISTFLFATALPFLISLAHANPLPGQIVVDPDNRSWLKYHDGGSFFLASPGDPEDFLYRGSLNCDGTRNGDQQALIKKISGTGSNGIYFQVIRSHGGDGDSTHNPFVNNDPSLGINVAVLDQWEAWFDEMDANEVVIYLFFYDDSAIIWDTGRSVGSEERVFFEAIVNRFEHHRHLIWVVAEEYTEKLTSTRVSELASVIRNADDHDHPIAVHKLDGLSFSEFADDPNIDQFAIQYSEISSTRLHNGMVSAWNNANGRYNLNMSEAALWGSGAIAREKAWAVALGGAYVMVLGMDIANTAISDLEDLGRLRYFMESTNFNEMSPRDDLASADTSYVLAAPGTSYIAYGGGGVSTLGLTMVAGIYDLRWFDPVSGVTIEQASISVQDGVSSFVKPSGIGNEVALYINRVNAIVSVSSSKPPSSNLATILRVAPPLFSSALPGM